ncbi:MAG: MATE family efflux transporter [Flavobacterium nitrogenifigens]|uniref:Membrane protein involved in the export of O-antigen and teichoic acid n=1 Tax=Flavobacterium nitrogenifigens TaxID=1617283 RepID=A0A521EDH3_9FLAO|nr:MATE family efflux transporter [Flavobacterium nitrogenifigens]KAF2325916.1 MATE family efflux transporter [Flavobacterium nitrogenifigens]MDQ8013350.1 MATE family efflux transporter [Flavobacterium nitrogenifigens]SMO81969.1 Membrane protein involved in the export of O-antigen and teichoic acid [Flavobacterium nitrogenifigens]
MGKLKKGILINDIKNKINIESKRNKNILKHIGWSFFFKIGTIAISFILIPITIDYLDTDNYGVWLTLSSFISWFSFFDIGLGNGLRNKFTEAKANNNYEIAKAYVSSAYFTIGAISLFIVLVFFILNQFIDWTLVFNTKESLSGDLSVLLPIIFAFFGLQLVSKLIVTIYQADQHHSIEGKIQFFSQLLSLIVIWLLTKTNRSSLLLFGSLISAIPVVILLIFNFISFNTTYLAFKPEFKLWKREHLNDISNLGFKFFIVQIASLVLFSSDNFIIIKLFGPEDVVKYNLAFKYFSIVTMGYTILLTPFWSSFTEAYVKKDFIWIRRTVSTVQKIWLLVPILLLIMIFISKWFYNFWIGNNIEIPLNLSLSMALFVLMMTFNMIYVNFINGVGKIKLQLYTSIITMIINIPLSIFFGKYLGWGPSGVVLATCCSLIYAIILRPLQYFKIINNTAKGIWNK